jgi:hypothetical protein
MVCVAVLFGFSLNGSGGGQADDAVAAAEQRCMVTAGAYFQWGVRPRFEVGRGSSPKQGGVHREQLCCSKP